MKRRFLVTLGFAAWVLAVGMPAASGAAVEVVDDTGKKLSLPRPAERIVSLAPHVTELLYAAGAGAHLIAAVEYSDYPAAARALPRLGNAGNLDVEAILALRPDLVVAWQSGNPRGQVEQLRRLGLPVFESEPRRLDDIPSNMERLGILAGTPTEAREAAARFRGRLSKLQQRYRNQRRLRVFYQVWNAPLITIGGAHVISDVLRVCGGDNVFARLSVLAPEVSVEAVLAANPDAIIASGAGPERPTWLDAWGRWPQLAAVKRGALYWVPPDLMHRHTPRLLDGAERVCEQLALLRRQDSR